MNEERQVRVFISSTFRDMHAERDHLVTFVFPELRERGEQLGLEFFDVDPGGKDECRTMNAEVWHANGETANSWEYCRQWIDRIEPFFVCIPGQRYGWVTEPRHFRNPADRQRQQQEPRLITTSKSATPSSTSAANAAATPACATRPCVSFIKNLMQWGR